MKKRKLMLCWLFVALVLTVTACNAPSAAGGSPTQAAPPALNFSLLLTDGDAVAAWGEDSTSAYLRDRFNLNIEVLHIALEADRALQTLCAADALPDALYLRRDDNFLWLIEQGHLLALDDYLEDYDGYAGNISARALEMSRVRDHVYSLLSGSTDTPSGNGGWVLRSDLHEDLGSPALDTLKDVYEYLLLARGSLPEPMLLGVPFDMSQIYVAHGGERTPYLFGLHVYIDPQTGKFAFIGDDAAFEKSMLYVRKLFTNGLLPSDWFVMQKDQVSAQLESGKFALFAARDVTGTPLFAMQNAKAGAYRVISPPRAQAGDDADVIYTGSYNLLGAYGISISKRAQQPERIFQYFDFIASDEGQRLTQFGPPGAIYDGVDEAGYPVLNEAAAGASSAYRMSLGLGNWSYPYMMDYATGASMAANAQYTTSTWDLGAQWRAQMLNAHSLDVTNMANIEPTCAGTERNAILLCEDIYTNYLPRMLCAASDDEALALLDEMNRQVKATGFDFVLSHYDWFHQLNLTQSGR